MHGLTAGSRSRTGRLAAVLATAGVCLGGAPQARQAADIPVVRLDTSGAAPLPAVQSLPASRLDDRPRAADLDRPAAVSLTFSQPLALRDLLLLLFRGTPFSLVLDSGVNGTFTGELSELSLRQALEAVLRPAEMDYAIEGTVVRVFPRRMETRLFEVTRLDVTRTWRRAVRSAPAPDAANPSAELSTASDGDFFRELSAGINSLLSSSGRAHVDRKAGLVQVTDFGDRLDRVAVYLEAVAARSTRQVRLNAYVLEVTLASAQALDWRAISARPGVRAGTGAGIKVDDFDALLKAIGSFGTVRVIAAPQMVALNNEPAVMRIGAHHAAFGPSDGTGEPRRGDSGGEAWTLTIVPQISADGIVQMSVSPTFSSHASGDQGSSLIEADSAMRVRGGETVVISGFLRDVAETVPATGVSGMFGGKDRRVMRTELVILLTPTVVAPGTDRAGAQ